MFQCDLGTRTGVQVSALGLGCWAIGGPFTFNGQPAGWGEVDDDESIRAIRHALELGVTLGEKRSHRARRPLAADRQRADEAPP